MCYLYSLLAYFLCARAPPRTCISQSHIFKANGIDCCGRSHKTILVRARPERVSSPRRFWFWFEIYGRLIPRVAWSSVGGWTGRERSGNPPLCLAASAYEVIDCPPFDESCTKKLSSSAQNVRGAWGSRGFRSSPRPDFQTLGPKESDIDDDTHSPP